MFEKPTVFVLGAGASWHYGYPTGETLVRRVIEKAENLANFFSYGASNQLGNVPAYARRNLSPADPWTSLLFDDAMRDAQMLGKRLRQVNPTLIDYFLAQNEELQDIGRLAIAMEIFHCESEYHRLNGNKNHWEYFEKQRRKGFSHSTSVDLKEFEDDWLRFILYKITVGCKTSADLLKK